MVLIAMATAMTLAIGWLASQDNAPLVAANATRAAAARATAQCGLELAASILESDAPWRTDHADGWILQSHPLGDGTLSVRLFDEQTALPPTDATTVVRIEAIASVNEMEQTAAAIATVHPFDERSRGDLSGYAAFATEFLALRGTSRIQAWRGSGQGPRAIGTLGETHFTGRSSRDVRQGALCLHTAPGETSWATGAPPVMMPTSLGELGLTATPLPAGPDIATDDDFEPSDRVLPRWSETTVQEDITIEGDLHIERGAIVRVAGDSTVQIVGDLIMERDSVIEVIGEATLKLVVSGDVSLDKAIIGGPQESSPRSGVWRQRHINWTAPDQVLLSSPSGAAPSEWDFDNRSLVQAIVQSPTASISLNRSTVTGRLAGRSIELRSGARMYFDLSSPSGTGLAALSEVTDALDLMDQREDGLDATGRAEMIARIEALLSRPADQCLTAPTDGWWVSRPYPVETSMMRCGGDVDRWEGAALAAVDAGATP